MKPLTPVVLKAKYAVTPDSTLVSAADQVSQQLLIRTNNPTIFIRSDPATLQSLMPDGVDDTAVTAARQFHVSVFPWTGMRLHCSL